VSVFVTVGTTSFDQLIEAVDNGEHASTAFLQIADGDYRPVHARWCRMLPGIDVAIERADIVVCHAGAGTVFGLLQAGLVPIVVPNLFRRDKHQAELGRWLARRRYAIVASGPDEVNDRIARYAELAAACAPFDTPRFFMTDRLNALVNEALPE